MQTMRWTCVNCEREAGKLEQAHEWQGNIICQECHARLSAPAHAASAVPASKIPTHQPPGPGQIICPNPNCGKVGTPICKSRGSVLIMVFLLLIGIIPGLLYALLASGYDYFCPNCGMKLRSEHR